MTRADDLLVSAATARRDATDTAASIQRALDDHGALAVVAELEEHYDDQAWWDRQLAGVYRHGRVYPRPMFDLFEEADSAYRSTYIIHGLPTPGQVPEPLFDAQGLATEALCAHRERQAAEDEEKKQRERRENNEMLRAMYARTAATRGFEPGGWMPPLADVVLSRNGSVGVLDPNELLGAHIHQSTIDEFQAWAPVAQRGLAGLGRALERVGVQAQRTCIAVRDLHDVLHGVDHDLRSSDPRTRALALRRGRGTGPDSVPAGQRRRPRQHHNHN